MKISVIGDSHTRIFSNNNIFTPFFFGPGSSYNLIHNPIGIKKKIRHTITTIKKEFDYKCRS